MRQQGDQSVLAQKGRLTRHVGAGQKPKPRVVIRIREIAIVGDKRPVAGLAKGLLTDRMPPRLNLKSAGGGDDGPGPAFLRRQRGEGGGEVDLRQRPCCSSDPVSLGDHGVAEGGEDLPFDL